MSAAAPATPARAGLTARRGRAQLGELGFQGLVLSGLLISLGILVVLLVDITSSAIPVFQERGTDFLTNQISGRPARTGLLGALLGSLQIAIITMVVAFPLGIATAIYLEEYARDSRFTRIVDISIRNLAGVPSVVYGLLGLALFVRLLGIDGPVNLTGGRTALAGGLTMGLLALPIVVITAAEAIRAVPNSLRQGGYGLGATPWEVTSRLVLPSAAPGMLTGMILSLSRAIGETAPLIVIGAAFVSNASTNILTSLRDPFTALPVQVFTWAKRPQLEFKEEVAPAAILVLLAFTLTMNAVAIWLRNRYEKKA